MKDKYKSKQKPETTPFFRYYLIDPIQGLGWEITDALESFWHWITGAWYCDHCKKYHGRRVTKYSIKPSPIERPSNAIVVKDSEDLHVCSLGRGTQLNNNQCNEDQAN